MSLSTNFDVESGVLAVRYLDGSASPEEVERLDALLVADPARREWFATLCIVVTGLGEVSAAPSPSQGDAESPEINIPPPINNPSLFGDAYHGTMGFFSQEVPLAWLITTVIMGMLLLGAWAIKVTNHQHIAEAPSQSVPSDVRQEMVFVGRITGMVDVKWSDDLHYLPPLRYAHVPLGRKYILSSGLLEITYDSGAKVILEGPCTYEVESTAGGYLSLGKLTAKVEKGRSEVRGQRSDHYPLSTTHYPLFSVRTPTAIITDLGTEFAVEVDGQDAAMVCVFEGAVSVVDRNSQGRELVRAGEAIQMASGTIRRVDSGKASKHFVRRIRPRTVTTFLTDDFSMPSLNRKWKWDNPHYKNKYSLTERPGWLRISLATGNEDTWAGRRGDGPFLRTETSNYPAPSFSVETLVDIGTANGGNAPIGLVTGLMLYDTDHYVPDDSTNTYYPFDFTYGFHQSGNKDMRIEVQACGVHEPLLSTSVTFTSAYLKMDRDDADKTWTMYYKRNAADPWTRLGVVDVGSLPGGGTTEMELGLFAKTYRHHSSEAKVDFDYYRVTPNKEDVRKSNGK